MGKASFLQSSFLSGQWSPLVQGRMTEPSYKEAMNVCYNGFPLESGPWTRRPGTRYIAHTKEGAAGKLLAFDFSITQPYQMELTDGWLRFYAGLSLVTTTDDVTILRVTTDTPAKVIFADAIPTGWEDGTTILFKINSVPCSAPLLCGRQFILGDKDSGGQSFTLTDALTGEDIDGSVIDYQDPAMIGADADEVQRVFELETPYDDGAWSAVRVVQDINNVLLLHKDFEPQLVLGIEGVEPFSIDSQAFTDGPYLDINKTDTTMVLSAFTGSVSVSLSAAIGVNDDAGFVSTDVGRLLRFQAGPAEWDVGTTYAKAAKVLGSDNNIYTSIAGGNIGNDPTTDNDAAFWEITGQTVTWTWLQITAVSGPTSATATIMGEDIPTGTATTQWRIGRFSDTTGWPSCAAYHEGRLWVAGAASNHVDGSKSNDYFNFSPTDTDGTVADDNAVSATANAKNVNAIFWLLSTDDGLMAGTQAGEWRVRASQLDDPISPTSIQMRRVSSYGCADIEPIDASQTIFVQRQRRKLMAHVRETEGKYFAENISLTADNLTKNGIEEIVWQPEPTLNIWARRADGTLLGCTFKKAQSSYALKSLQAIWGQSAIGWHEHSLGSGRSVTSISSGPSFDGLSDTLYLISESPIDEVHWVEMLMPIFDDQQMDWANSFVDAGVSPCCAKKQSIDDGDTFDGIRVWGVYHLIGATVTPVVGGLDCGDHIVVAPGYLDIPYLSDPDRKFTEAFLDSFADEDVDYGVFNTVISLVVDNPPIVPVITEYAMTTHIGIDGDGVTASYNGNCLIDQFYNNLNDLVYQIQGNSGPITAGIRKLDGLTGNEILHMSEANIFSPDSKSMSPGDPWIYSPGPFNGDGEPGEGWIVGPLGATNSKQWCRINANTLKVIDYYGIASSAFTPDIPNTHIPAPHTSACAARTGSGHGHGIGRFEDFLVYGGAASGSQANWVICVWLGEGGMEFTGANQIAETDVDVCTGWFVAPDRHGLGTVIACGHPRYGVASPNRWRFYEFTIRRVNDAANFMIRRTIGDLLPPDVDATWTNFANFSGVMFDKADGNVLVFARTDDAVTHQYYLVKISSSDGSIIWKTAIDDAMNSGFDGVNQQSCANQYINGTVSFMDTGVSSQHKLYSFNTIDGTYTTFETNHGHLISGNYYWQPFSASATFFGGYGDAGSPDPTPYGQWLDNGHPATSNKWHRVFFGYPGLEVPPDPAETASQLAIPSNIGFTYTSRGQLLRPDYGVDAGPQNGPAFAKKRRIHWFGASVYRTRKLKIGADFDNLFPVKFETNGGTPYVAPALFTGIVSDTIKCDYNFEGQIAWEVTRPYNVTITALSGYIESMDK